MIRQPLLIPSVSYDHCCNAPPCPAAINQAEHVAHVHDGDCKHHHAGEKDAMSFSIYPEEGTELHHLEAAVRALVIPELTWAAKFQQEDVAFGIWKVRSCVCK